jgi:hypothetical protein
VTEWESLGGGITSAPAICSWGPSHLEVFARGEDQALWHRRFLDGWGEWQSLGGTLTSPPAAVSWGEGRVDVFARGTDRALWHRWYDGSWHGWESLGGELNFGPAVSSWGSRRLDVFARGTDNAIWQRTFDDGWRDWTSIGSEFTTIDLPGISAVSPRDGRIDLVAWFQLRGNLGWRDFRNDIWQTPRPLTTGGENAMNTSIALTSWRADRYDLFLRGEDLGLVHLSGFLGDDASLRLTFPPAQLGGVLTSGPAAVARRGDRWIDVVARGTDNALWRTLALNTVPD